jgi:predicted nucleotidyltransferase
MDDVHGGSSLGQKRGNHTADHRQVTLVTAGREAYLPARPILWHSSGMKTQEALDILRRHERALRERGVRRAALFGSVARGESRPGSDIDVMIEVEPEAHITVFEYAGLKEYIAGLFDGPVDVVNVAALKPYVRPTIATDAIYAF